MSRRWPVVLWACLAVPAVSSTGTGAGTTTLHAQTAARNLTLSPASGPTPAQTPREPWESRARTVAIDLGALPDRATAAAPAGAGAEVRIDLFNGRSIRAVWDHFDPNASGVTWVGRVPGVASSLVTIVYGGGLLAANIALPDATYSIRPVPIDPVNPSAAAAQPLHVLAEVDQAALPPEAEPLVVAIPDAALEQAADAVMADTADVVELLMVYTANAEAWAGGPAGILNLINLGVSQTNSAYDASGVHHRVQLVHAERVAYAEVSSFSTNLTNLRGGFGALNVVPALRDVYGADLVSMLVRPTAPDACGIAFLMTSVTTAFAPNGYSVVDTTCVSQSTLAHEIGHNMGLRHDWYMDAGLTPFTYAHGYVNPMGRFRTIMAYPNSCTALGFGCTRLVAFSNPELLHEGFPMGVAGGTNISCPTGNANNMTCDADERRALNDTAFTVANFRQATTLRPPLIVGHPANQTVVQGQSFTLQVAASGLGPMSYQWYRGQSPSTLSPVVGGTSSTYSFVLGSDGIWYERVSYWVRVSNEIGSTNSISATITVVPGGSTGVRAGPPPLRTRALVVPARPAGSATARTGVADLGSAATGIDEPDDPPAAEEWPAICTAQLAAAAIVTDLMERRGTVGPAARVQWLRQAADCYAGSGAAAHGARGGERPPDSNQNRQK